MTPHSSRLDVLQWLARLPFLGVDDLALLTGQPEPDIEGVLREMEQDGLVDSVTPSSPELDTAPVHILSEPTRRWLTSTLGEAAVRTLPLAWRDIVHRLVRLEATVALNVFAAGIVASLHRSADREVADLRALPVRRPQDAWWPPGVQGYGCIRATAGAAPFFVTVDRAGAPAAHRAALVAAWYRFRESSQPWGNDIPPILVLCPGPVRENDWARTVLASAERRDVVPLRFLSTSVATGAEGVAATAWRQAYGGGRAGLLEWLPVWHAEHLSLPSAAVPDVLPAAPSEERQSLSRWAHNVTGGACSATRFERAAAIALTTSMVEKAVIECLGRHPLLSEAELATVLHLDPRVVRRAVERATALSLIVRVERPGDHCRRYCLGSAGLHSLAVRDGVPVRRYARHAPITVLPAGDGERVPTLLQQYEHTTGANSFFVAWLDSPAGGPHLLAWLSAADSAIRFESGGRRSWLRPDGAGNLLLGDKAFPFLLEWDRGTERVVVLGTKLVRYGEYFRSCRLSGEPAPVLLFVTTTPQREDLVWRIAASALGPDVGRLLTTTGSLIERLTPRGCVWRRQADSPRQHWPSSPTHQNPNR
ncbi:MAG: replication-relaxation family protein [Thermoflexaceae bacterium]|nr:replication-relaxation family protein [Thermoflexaceae bacterium]